MKKLLTIVLVLTMTQIAGAQRLIPISRYLTKWNTETVSTVNKANGYIYRLRKDVRADLPNVQETQNLELYIAEPTDIGWMGFFRSALISTDYDFVVVLYDKDQQPLEVINLCDITNNRYCEVQDVRWDADNHYLLFNMACPSYSADINGKGSKLYCYDPQKRKLVWETPYLVSNDIFILDKKYVFCSYGFTNERKYLFMLDKKTGKMYQRIPMQKDIQYMELKMEGNSKMLYVVDNKDRLSTFRVSDTSAPIRKTKIQTRKRSK